MRLSRYGIVLESLSEDHLEMVRLWRNQEFVRCNMEYKELISREQQEEWYSQLDKERNLYWIIRTHDYPIGLIHIKSIDKDQNSGEAGIFVGEPSYLEMPQPMLAILFMMELGFFSLGLKLLRAKIRSGNTRAITFNQKLGYSLVPDQPEGFQYYEVLKDTFELATSKLRSQSKHMYGSETTVESVSNLGELGNRLVRGISKSDKEFHPKFV